MLKTIEDALNVESQTKRLEDTFCALLDFYETEFKAVIRTWLMLICGRGWIQSAAPESESRTSTMQ